VKKNTQKWMIALSIFALAATSCADKKKDEPKKPEAPVTVKEKDTGKDSKDSNDSDSDEDETSDESTAATFLNGKWEVVKAVCKYDNKGKKTEITIFDGEKSIDKDQKAVAEIMHTGGSRLVTGLPLVYETKKVKGADGKEIEIQKLDLNNKASIHDCAVQYSFEAGKDKEGTSILLKAKENGFSIYKNNDCKEILADAAKNANKTVDEYSALVQKDLAKRYFGLKFAVTLKGSKKAKLVSSKCPDGSGAGEYIILLKKSKANLAPLPPENDNSEAPDTRPAFLRGIQDGAKKLEATCRERR